MIEVVPALITANSPADFAAALTKLNFAPRLHIDIADGVFASRRTLNLNQIYWPENVRADLHLMMEKPLDWLEMIVSLKPNLVICHSEIPGAHEILPRLFGHLRKFQIQCGLAILPETSVESARDLILAADQVLIFGGKLGWQGGVADLTQLEKIPEIKQIKNVQIGWDGGANLQNVKEIIKAGVEVVNVGSAIANAPDPEKVWREMTAAANAEKSAAAI
ncbi:MAG: hypothetical protein LBM73_00590 [Candidatus Nomurabacteria bacterium]|jgi:ribulose-phosphate 3-epimerase|nr:hypothetical protein [Candidatus Nomurabacteria bacterium]